MALASHRCAALGEEQKEVMTLTHLHSTRWQLQHYLYLGPEGMNSYSSSPPLTTTLDQKRTHLLLKKCTSR
jgi:hypothetical protein